MSDLEPDYDHLLRSNVQRVFNEREPQKRAAAIAELYVAEPTMYEADEIVAGREAISALVGKLLDRFGPDFTFTPQSDAVGHHGLAMLRWQAGAPDAPVTGTDIVEVVDGRIARLWVFLNPPKS